MSRFQSDSTVDLSRPTSGAKLKADDDMPTAMEAEVYVDGKLQVKRKTKNDKNKDKKKSKEDNTNYFAELCKLLRSKMKRHIRVFNSNR